jgi:hypothetical protein
MSRYTYTYIQENQNTSNIIILQESSVFTKKRNKGKKKVYGCNVQDQAEQELIVVALPVSAQSIQASCCTSYATYSLTSHVEVVSNI